ncbi:hypothetical protein [Enterovibrio norvegicus]|uniref:hypothetical protein n=1 Tax=Enterovibrio norvegicus TaxID=188144 RepID=UPI001F5264A2|nr:hypothetical protein [Enterovibrio norvegicus]
MYINYCQYFPLDERSLRQEPRDRYTTYFKDLYRISDKDLSHETFLAGDQYSYTNIIDSVLDGNLPFAAYPEISDVAFSYWTPEWDPEYSAFATYFLWKSDVDAEIIDVCDVGSIATTTALHILFNTDSLEDPRTKILVGMEQNSVPRYLPDNNMMPTHSSGSALFVSQANSEGALFKLEDSLFLNENKIYSSNFVLAEELQALLDKHKLGAGDCSLLLQRNTAAFKQLDYLSDKGEIPADLLRNAHYLPAHYSVNTLPKFLGEYQSNPDSFRSGIWVFIDEDAESLNTTISLLRAL